MQLIIVWYEQRFFTYKFKFQCNYIGNCDNAMYPGIYALPEGWCICEYMPRQDPNLLNRRTWHKDNDRQKIYLHNHIAILVTRLRQWFSISLLASVQKCPLVLGKCMAPPDLYYTVVSFEQPLLFLFRILNCTLRRATAVTLIARFMGPIWGPSGAKRWAPCCPHELCYLGSFYVSAVLTLCKTISFYAWTAVE